MRARGHVLENERVLGSAASGYSTIAWDSLAALGVRSAEWVCGVGMRSGYAEWVCGVLWGERFRVVLCILVISIYVILLFTFVFSFIEGRITLLAYYLVLISTARITIAIPLSPLLVTAINSYRLVQSSPVQSSEIVIYIHPAAHSLTHLTATDPTI